MAKQNKALLCGICTKLSVRETKATMVLTVVRPNRKTGDETHESRQDFPIVATENPALMEKIASFSQNDIIFVKGVIVTVPANKRTICPHCGGENYLQGTLVYIEPIFIEKWGHGETAKEAIDIINERNEISNSVELMGNLCCDPQVVPVLKKTKICQYQIAIPRTFRVPGNEEDTDFPWIKSYGNNAKEDLIRLKKGSRISIDGYIQSRIAKRETHCEHCEKKYKWDDNAMEIVPFETEYMAHYITDEDLGIVKDYSKDASEE